MSNILSIFIVVFVSFPIFTTQANEQKEEQVLLLNSFVLNQFDDGFNELLPLPATKSNFDHLKAYNVHDLNFEKHIDFFKHVSHDVGICGGYSQIAKSDLSRIQKNLLAQKNLQQQEKFLNFKVTHQNEIQKQLGEVSASRLQQDVNFITQFKNRTARGSDNTEIEKIKNYILSNIPSTSLTYTTQLISHRRTPQKTIHIQIKGKSDTRLVMGGHVDSINMGFSSVAPGADDNASGSAALIQVLNAVLKNNTLPNYTLDFFWYAGEESGLIGSGEIAKDYAKNKTPVVAVLQLDMLGVPDNSQRLYLESDFSSTKLNTFITEVAATYLPQIQITSTSCGYPCSDHSSWYQENYPVVFPTSGNVSGTFNHRIHTQRDTADTIDFSYAEQVARLALAFLLSADAEL